MSCTEIKQYCDQKGISSVSRGNLNKLKDHFILLSRKKQLADWGAFSLKDFEILEDLSAEEIKELRKKNPKLDDFIRVMKSSKIDKLWNPGLLRNLLQGFGFKGVTKSLKGDALLKEIFDNSG